jgi:hypothetical protein
MRTVIGSVLLVASSQAFACGYCVEDKIAATYDHGVVTRAFGQKHQVVFLHVEGTVPSGRLLERAIYSAPAVDRDSARVSADLLTVSFAYDPARATLGATQSRIEKALAAHGVSLVVFEVMERPAELKAIRNSRSGP